MVVVRAAARAIATARSATAARAATATAKGGAAPVGRPVRVVIGGRDEHRAAVWYEHVGACGAAERRRDLAIKRAQRLLALRLGRPLLGALGFENSVV